MQSVAPDDHRQALSWRKVVHLACSTLAASGSEFMSVLRLLRNKSRWWSTWSASAKAAHRARFLEPIDSASEVGRRPTLRSLSSAMMAEALENRILFSATPESLIGFSEFDLSAIPVQDQPVPNPISSAVTDLKTSTELVFIDAHVQNQEQLLRSLSNQQGRTFSVHVLEADRDGVEQVTDVLRNYREIDTVHIVSHGTSGSVQLGNSWLTVDNLNAYQSDLSTWNASLRDGADLFFYGCSIAASDDGQALLQQLGSWAQVDVAASSDNTGGSLLGGNWTMEYQFGQIENSIAFGAGAQNNWNHLLATFVVTNTNDAGAGSLRQAISNANVAAGLDTITFNIPITDGRHFYYQDDGVAGSLSNVVATALPDASISDFDPDYPNAPFSWFSINLNPAASELDITDAVFIDGYSQPGASQNNLAVGHNATLRIELTSFGPDNDRGINVEAGGAGSTIRGLAINRFDFAGILTDPGADGVTIQGNYLGTDITGTLDLGNGDAGVHLRSGGNLIGGPNSQDRNVISGNSSRGIVTYTFGPIVSDNVFENNYIGVDSTGLKALGNDTAGIQMFNQNNAVIRDNVISGNLGEGIWFRAGSTNTNILVVGNRIGIGADGLTKVANTAEGIQIEGNTSGIELGGAGIGDGNIIGGNAGQGVLATGAGVIGTKIIGNWIGTDASGTIDLGNGGSGITFTGGTSGSIVGDVAAGHGNTIAFNSLDGVAVLSGVNNSIRGNSIFANGNLSIDLFGFNGVNPNDAGDGDSGSNNLQNFPVLTSATYSGADLTISGMLNSIPNVVGMIIDFYWSSVMDATGFGEAEHYLGSTVVNTDGSGNASFLTIFAQSLPVGSFVTATATSPTGSTSECSQNRPVAFQPTINLPGPVVNYTTGDPLTIIDSTAKVTDPDSINFSSGQLTVDFVANGTANDRLEIDTSGNISLSGSNVRWQSGGPPITIGTWSGGTDGSTPLVITLNTNADVAKTDDLLHSIGYRNVSGTPSGLPRTVRFVLTDGSGGTSDPATKMIKMNSPITAISDSDSGVDAVDENAVIGTQVGVTASADDPDVIDTITYALDDDAGGRFAIDSTTGVVTVANGLLLDRESAPSHSIIVRATSSDGSSMTRGFAIAVNDVDEFDVIPLMDSDSSTNQVNENAATGTVVGITASSSDADATNNTVAYSLDNNAGGRFAIDGTTGVVTVADGTLLDRESAASHTITVRATSVDGSSTTRSFSIALNDIDEFDVVPITDLDLAANQVNENATTGTVVGITASSSDADATNNTVAYSLDNNAGGRFAIDGTTGVVTVADGTLLDRESVASHTIAVRATSSDGSFSTRLFTIAVLPVNDNLPVFTSAAGQTANENQSFVQTLSATDADSPLQAITFSIVGGTDAALFSINGSDELRFITPPDFESPSDANLDNVYEVTIQASDGNGGITLQNVLVNVLDGNEVPSIIPASFSVAENSANGAMVGTVTAVDSDTGQSVTYSITGGTGASAFAIDPATGLLAVNDSSQLDFESTTSFSLVVQATDNGAFSLSATATLTVLVNNVNEPPSLASGTFAVSEGPLVGTIVGTLFGSDPDAGDVLNYAITGGNVGSAFVIDSATGVVSVANSSAIDAESITSFALHIQVSDLFGLTQTAVMVIHVNPVNDFVPIFTSPNTAGVLENSTIVHVLQAIDGDLPIQTIAFAISGGVDASRFVISGANQLRFVSAPDFESQLDANGDNVYHVQVTAFDGSGGNTTQSITVSVLPVNDNAPVFTSPAAPTVMENQTLGVVLAASDADQPTQTVAYTITGGADASRFGIDAAHQLVFLSSPDFEMPHDADSDSVYEVIVEANDGQGMSTFQLVRITVANTNDAPVSTDLARSTTAGEPIVESAPGVLASAVDPDGDTLVATLLTGPLHGSVTLNPDGSYVYVPTANFSGSDSFTYLVVDGSGGTSTGTVKISVGVTIPLLPTVDSSSTVASKKNNDDDDVTPVGFATTINLPSATGSEPGTRPSTARSETPPPSKLDIAAIEVTSPEVVNEESQETHLIRRANDSAPSVTRAALPSTEDIATEINFVTQQGLLWNDLDELQEQIHSSAELPYLALGGTASVATTLSVGYVVWLVRGGSILAGMMAQLPAWRLLDPLPVLAYFDDEDDEGEHEESLASLVDSANDNRSKTVHRRTTKSHFRKPQLQTN